MRKLLAAVVVVIVVVAAAAAVSRTAIWGRLHDPFKGYTGEEQFVIVEPGTGTAAIGRRLVEAGVVRDELAFRAALWWTGRSRALQAGEYRFDRPTAAVDVIERLARGDVYTRRLTFPEGLTIREMAEVFEARGFGRRGAFIEAAANVALIKDLDAEAVDLEGYLFPETYALPRDTPAERVIGMMVDRFRATYTDEWRRRAVGRGADHAAGRHAGVARGKGNRPGAGAAGGRRGVPQPHEDRHGPSGRSDRRLRDAKGGKIQRQHQAR